MTKADRNVNNAFKTEILGEFKSLFINNSSSISLIVIFYSSVK